MDQEEIAEPTAPEPLPETNTLPVDEKTSSKEETLQSQDGFKTFLEQDDLIQEGITLCCTRLAQLLKSMAEYGMPKEVQIKHRQWIEKITANQIKLADWELKNIGQQTFSQAFFPLMQYLTISRAE